MIYYHCEQKDANGCAIAALAMLTNLKYDKVMKLCKRKRYIVGGVLRDIHPLTLDEYIVYLTKTGFKFSSKKTNVVFGYNNVDKTINYLKSLKHDTLLETIHSPYMNYTHCVVYCHTSKRMFDPGVHVSEKIENFCQMAKPYAVVSTTRLISKH